MSQNNWLRYILQKIKRYNNYLQYRSEFFWFFNEKNNYASKNDLATPRMASPSLVIENPNKLKKHYNSRVVSDDEAFGVSNGACRSNGKSRETAITYFETPTKQRSEPFVLFTRT